MLRIQEQWIWRRKREELNIACCHTPNKSKFQCSASCNSLLCLFDCSLMHVRKVASSTQQRCMDGSWMHIQTLQRRAPCMHGWMDIDRQNFCARIDDATPNYMAAGRIINGDGTVASQQELACGLLLESAAMAGEDVDGWITIHAKQLLWLCGRCTPPLYAASRRKEGGTALCPPSVQAQRLRSLAYGYCCHLSSTLAHAWSINGCTHTLDQCCSWKHAGLMLC